MEFFYGPFIGNVEGGGGKGVNRVLWKFPNIFLL